MRFNDKNRIEVKTEINDFYANEVEVETSKNECTYKKTMSCNRTEYQSIDNNEKSLQMHFGEHSNNSGPDSKHKTNHKSVIKNQITAVNTEANDYQTDREDQ